MKRIIGFIAALAAVLPATFSCNKENEGNDKKGGAQVMLEQSATEITKTAGFKVNLTEAVSSTVVVTLAAVEGNGYVGADYLEFPQAVKIDQGATSKSVTVTVRPNPAGKTPLPAGTYKVSLKIASATNATVIEGADAVSYNYVRIVTKPTVTLEYDEDFDDMFVDNASSFIVSLTEEAYENVTVNLALSETPSVEGNAALSKDAFKQFPETVTLTPGQTEFAVSIILDPEKLVPNKINEAVITIASVSDNAQIGATNTSLSLFVQGPKKLNLREDWNIEYNGLGRLSDGQFCEAFTVTGPKDTECYDVELLSKNEFQVFYENSAIVFADSLSARVSRMFADSEVSVADYFFTGEEKVGTELRNPGEYIAIVLGLTDPASVTYDYNILEFTKEDASAAASYSDFLGNWVLNGETITISEKTEGESYYISNFPSFYDLKEDGCDINDFIEASFKDGHLEVIEQKIGTFDAAELFGPDYTGYGICDLTLSANISDGVEEFPGYPVNFAEPGLLFSAHLVKDETTDYLELHAGTIGFYTDESHTTTLDIDFEGASIAWTVENATPGKGEGNEFQNLFHIPDIVLPGEEPDENYSKWLGNWVFAGSNGPVNITIRQSVANSLMSIYGLGITCPLYYDPESGQAGFLFEQLSSGSKWAYFVAGSDDNYMAYGDDNGLLALATLAENGKSFTIVGNEYTAKYSDGSTYDMKVNEVGVYGYGARSDGRTGWVSFSDVEYFSPLPLTVTKSEAQGSISAPAGVKPSKVASYHYEYAPYSFQQTPKKAVSAKKSISSKKALKGNPHKFMSFKRI